MIEPAKPMIDAPIAGQSLTAELGNRPWQQPSQYDTVEEALEFYIPRLINPDMLEDLLDVMETGIPLTTIANALQSSGVMEGKHNLDVGMLVMPVLIETMAYLGDEAGIEYNIGTGNVEDPDKISEAAIARAVSKAREKQGEEPIQETMEEEPAQAEMNLETPSGGLMSRRTQDGV